MDERWGIMFGLEGNVGLKLLIILIVFLVASLLFDFIVRKSLKLERRKIFSYNHINKVHVRIDWSIRIAFMFILLASYIINYYYNLWYLQSYYVLLWIGYT
ncbi:DUF4181 domain-containing protein [Niallia sp. HCP3S3_B10]|uniref:DUF4181 domain-containing protein n=1 Tax=Niallia sp. HCP3S3_B10 TaxID=3438944 RepID=UPI003F8B1FBD